MRMEPSLSATSGRSMPSSWARPVASASGGTSWSRIGWMPRSSASQIIRATHPAARSVSPMMRSTTSAATRRLVRGISLARGGRSLKVMPAIVIRTRGSPSKLSPAPAPPDMAASPDGEPVSHLGATDLADEVRVPHDDELVGGARHAHVEHLAGALGVLRVDTEDDRAAFESLAAEDVSIEDVVVVPEGPPVSDVAVRLLTLDLCRVP